MSIRLSKSQQQARPTQFAIDTLLDKASASLRLPAPSSILFVRSDSYGDLLLFRPVLQAFAVHWPKTKVGLLLKAKHRDIVPLLPAGVEYLTTDADPNLSSLAESPAEQQVLELVRQFSPEVIVAPSYEKTWLHFLAASGAPQAKKITVGPAAIDILTREALTTSEGTIPIFDSEVRVEKNLHEKLKGRALVRHLIGPGLDIETDKIALEDNLVRRVQANLVKHKIHPKRFIVCNPAGVANVAIKTWRTSAYSEVLNQVCAKHELGVVLAVVQSEKDLARQVQNGLHPDISSFIWAGDSGEYVELAAICSLATAYLGNDTSTLHLCEALGVRVLGIYGGGFNERFHPSLPGSIGLSMPLPCFGCGWDCHFGNAPCLSFISPEHVRDSLEQVLKQADLDAPANTIHLPPPSSQFTELAANSRGKYEALQKDRALRYDQIVSLTALARKHQSESEEKQTRLSQLHHQLSEVTKAHQDAAKQLQSVTELLAFTERDSGMRLKQIETLTAMVKAQEAEALLLRNQVESLNQIARQMQTDLAAARSGQEACAARLANEVERHSASHKEQGERISKLEDQVAQSKRALDSGERQYSAAVASLEEEVRRAHRLEIEGEEARQALAEAKAALTQAAASITALSSEVQSLRKSLDEQKVHSSSLAQTLSETQAALAAEQRALADCNTRLDTTSKERNQYLADFQSLKTAFDEQRRFNDEFVLKLSSAQAAAQADREAHLKREADLTLALSASKSLCEAAHVALEEKTARIEQLIDANKGIQCTLEAQRSEALTLQSHLNATKVALEQESAARSDEERTHLEAIEVLRHELQLATETIHRANKAGGESRDQLATAERERQVLAAKLETLEHELAHASSARIMHQTALLAVGEALDRILANLARLAEQSSTASLTENGEVSADSSAVLEVIGDLKHEFLALREAVANPDEYTPDSPNGLNQETAREGLSNTRSNLSLPNIANTTTTNVLIQEGTHLVGECNPVIEKVWELNEQLIEARKTIDKISLAHESALALRAVLEGERDELSKHLKATTDALAQAESSKDELEAAAFTAIETLEFKPTADQVTLVATIDDAIVHEGGLLIRGWVLMPKVLKGKNACLALLVAHQSRSYSVRVRRQSRDDVVSHYIQQPDQGLWLESRCGIYAIIEGLDIHPGEFLQIRVIASSAKIPEPAFSAALDVQVK